MEGDFGRLWQTSNLLFGLIRLRINPHGRIIRNQHAQNHFKPRRFSSVVEDRRRALSLRLYHHSIDQFRFHQFPLVFVSRFDRNNAGADAGKPSAGEHDAADGFCAGPDIVGRRLFYRITDRLASVRCHQLHVRRAISPFHTHHVAFPYRRSAHSCLDGL